MSVKVRRLESAEIVAEGMEEVGEDLASLYSIEKPDLIIEGQYERALELMMDAYNAGIKAMAVVGPPGVGKTAITRYFAYEVGKPLIFISMSESVTDYKLVGSFDPSLVLKQGWVWESFEPGPLTISMLIGGIFLANELNRAPEYTQNVLLSPLEEGVLVIPRLGRIEAAEGFTLVAAMNPEDMAGTYRLSEALKDRIGVWVELDYPTEALERKIVLRKVGNISNSILNKIIAAVRATRERDDIKVPASPRASINIAKMATAAGHKLDERRLRSLVRSVLVGAIQPIPGADARKIVEEILGEVFD